MYFKLSYTYTGTIRYIREHFSIEMPKDAVSNMTGWTRFDTFLSLTVSTMNTR